MAPKVNFYGTKIFSMHSDCSAARPFQRKQIDDPAAQAEATSSTRSTRASARLSGTKNTTIDTIVSSAQKSSSAKNTTYSEAPQNK